MTQPSTGHELSVHGMLLAQLLAEIEASDADYQTRYGLVWRAAGAAAKAGLSVGARLDPSEPDWPVIYIELPDGQVSWHMPKHDREWDGHTTDTKYERCHAYAARYIPVFAGAGQTIRDREEQP